MPGEAGAKAPEPFGVTTEDVVHDRLAYHPKGAEPVEDRSLVSGESSESGIGVKRVAIPGCQPIEQRLLRECRRLHDDVGLAFGGLIRSGRTRVPSESPFTPQIYPRAVGEENVARPIQSRDHLGDE